MKYVIPLSSQWMKQWMDVEQTVEKVMTNANDVISGRAMDHNLDERSL